MHDGLARCDALLGASRFLCGAAVTEADVRLLPTAARFDGVYASFFRCGRKQARAARSIVRSFVRSFVCFVHAASRPVGRRFGTASAAGRGRTRTCVCVCVRVRGAVGRVVCVCCARARARAHAARI